MTWFEFQGIHAPFYWIMIACKCAVSLVLWWRGARRRLPMLVTVAALVNVGMWLERVLIISETLSRGHLPSQWRVYWPTLWDWALLAGTLGFLAWMCLLFVRLVPAVSMHEVKQQTAEARM